MPRLPGIDERLAFDADADRGRSASTFRQRGCVPARLMMGFVE
jgi:hypothetical protein